jgi:NAD(P)-dependent dehydrogenase (short-subunit alcohol dehydrogenase family)
LRALVTGASSGLGLHFAQLLARHGADVTLAARRVKLLERNRDTIIEAGGRSSIVELDVSDPRSVAALFENGETFDIVINNAGISRADNAFDVSETDWDEVMRTNLMGAFLVARSAAMALKEKGKGGSIVNVASILGLRVAGSLTAYGTSKAGLIHMTKSMALEWAKLGIRVNALCPGYIETDLNRNFFASSAGKALIQRIPQKRLGRPDELDGALMLLCSAAGAYITGSSIVVDGGHMVSSL